MAYTVEKLLWDAQMLVNHLKEHDCTADILISQTQTLHKRVDGMKEYQDDLTELNEIAKHKPRSTLVIGIAQENRQIRELQMENWELKESLEEHQSALELIMRKYREQVKTLIETNKWEKNIADSSDQSKDLEMLINKICEMANVMQKSVTVDEGASSKDRERLTQLEIENKGLRELLEICSTSKLRITENSSGNCSLRGDSLDRDEDDGLNYSSIKRRPVKEEPKEQGQEIGHNGTDNGEDGEGNGDDHDDDDDDDDTVMDDDETEETSSHGQGVENEMGDEKQETESDEKSGKPT